VRAEEEREESLALGRQQLSPVQQEAVRFIASPAIVTAGAGSGKTRTLTHKIAYLVNELKLRPEKILAITFTNKAAAEMKGRLERITGRPVEDFPWVRTFHSACFKILKEDCELMGYRKPLSIHDETQQKTHMKKVLAELGLDKKYLGAAVRMVSHAKNSGDPLKYLNLNGKLLRKREVYSLYNEMLEESNAVDFDDILLLSRDLLKRFPEIREGYRNAFDYILIDEYQDTNNIQNEIVDLLLRDGNLTVVGDDYQSIYKFRGAEPLHFIHFPKKHAEAKVFRLEENYRSTAQIVAAADALIANNTQRMAKTCFSMREGEPIQVRQFPDEGAEAEGVAGKCWEYAGYRAIPLDEIAILYRTKFTSLPFERALRYARVPYTMAGAQGFFQRREIQDINAYLITATNPRDEIAFERILNVPKRGIGAAALKKILSCREKGMTLQEACWKCVQRRSLPPKTAVALEALLQFLEALRAETPKVAIERVLREMHYEGHLQSLAESNDDYESRRENIEQMIFDASRKGSLVEYLEDAALLREDHDVTDSKTGVRLSTIHAAKGLEFKVVFVVGLEEGLLPHSRSLDLETALDYDEGVEEERRLMYVAMTRASDHLHLSLSQSRRGEATRPSRFLEEIPPNLLDLGGNDLTLAEQN
jgi:DNA helicase II / ATP-dependent DNA helicase PcrA